MHTARNIEIINIIYTISTFCFVIKKMFCQIANSTYNNRYIIYEYYSQCIVYVNLIDFN